MKKIMYGLLGALEASHTLKIIVIFAVVVIASKVLIPEPPPPPPKTQEQIVAEQKAQAKKAAFDGVRDRTYSCRRAIKETLKDPDSFQQRGLISLPLEGGGTRILIQYGAKNSFGGYVVNEQWCDYKTLPYALVREGSR